MPSLLASEGDSVFDAIYIDGYRNLASTLAKITLLDEMIQITLYDPSVESKIQTLQFSYSSIELLNIAQEREITALRTFLVGPLFAAWLKKKTLILMIGIRKQDGLLQIPSFKIEASVINACYEKLRDRIEKAKKRCKFCGRIMSVSDLFCPSCQKAQT